MGIQLVIESLGALYHWSPEDRRAAILREGLVPLSRSTVGSGEMPYVCLAPTPSGAWGISGDMDWAEDVEEWDLYQIRLGDSDHARVRLDWGPRIVEVRVHNVIPPDRCWWVGRRTPW